MDLRVFVEPQQGTTYERLLALATRAEELGYDGFFSSDHYLAMGSSDGQPGPTNAWTTLAGLARDTSRLRLGTLVTPVTFRYPGNFAIAVAQVDAMSGGRIELGLGAGWFDDEHRSHGIPFPPVGERFDMLEEQLEIITGMWATESGNTFSFEGDRYTVIDSPGLPKPVQKPRPPIILGGSGPKRTPRLAALHADEFNCPFMSVDEVVETRDRVHAACRAHDRDPATMLLSVSQVVCCGADEAEVERRAAAIGREPDEVRQAGIAGTPDECVAKIKAFESVGVTRIYLQVLDDTDLDHLDLVDAEVASQL